MKVFKTDGFRNEALRNGYVIEKLPIHSPIPVSVFMEMNAMA